MKDWATLGFDHTSLGVGSALLGASFLFALLHFLMEPWRWKLAYLRSMTVSSNMSYVRDALFCTALASYLFPFKLGIPLRFALLHRKADLNLHFISIVVAIDGLLSIAVWTFWSGLCAWIAALHWRPHWYVWGGGIVAIAAVAFAFAMRTRRGGNWLERWHAAMVLLERPWLSAGLSATILAVDVLTYAVRHALLLWLVTGSVREAVTGGAIGVVATFAGIISGLPMGLVGYDATLITLLAAAGIQLDQAIAVAILNRGLNIVSAVLVGVPAAIRLRLGSGVMSILEKLWELSHGGK